MIVKDEEQLLPGCLASVSEVVDEIVLVDTGSLDGTVAIGEQVGAIILHQAWQGDFSAARNLGLAAATGDWILVMDADERMPADSAASLRVTLEQTKAEALRVHVRDRVSSGEQPDYLINLSTRLFRNRPEYRYQRRVHEQIETSIQTAQLGPPTENCNLTIEHLGYLPEVVQRKQKRERNLRLLEEEVATLPDGFACYNLGVEYIRQQRYQEALQLLDQAISLLDSNLLVAAEAMHRKVLCLMEMDDFPAALQAVEQGLRRYPDFTDLAYHRGEILLQLQRHRDAIEAFQLCRQMGESKAGYYSLQGISQYRSAYAIGLVYQSLRNFPAAKQWFRQCLRENPGFIPAATRIAEILCELLPEPAAAGELGKYFDQSKPEARLTYLQVLLAVRCYQSVFALVEELLPSYPQATRLLSAGAISAFHTGHFEQCIRWGEQLTTLDPSLLEPLLWVMVAHWVRGELDLAQMAVSRLSGRQEDMLHAVCQQMQWYVEGRDDFSLRIDFSDPRQHEAFHSSALQVLRLVVITGQRSVLQRVLPILSPLEGLEAWQQLGLYYAEYGLDDLAWAELRDCDRQSQMASPALLALGKLALRRRQLDLAVAYLQRVLQQSPDQIEARQLLALSCRQLAEQILLEGIERFPDAQVLAEELAQLKREGEDGKCRSISPSR
jgi:tetratricopeptide (TPR) repeat protein